MIELCVSVTRESDLNQLVEAGATTFVISTSEFSDRHYNEYTKDELVKLSKWCHNSNIKLNVFVYK